MANDNGSERSPASAIFEKVMETAVEAERLYHTHDGNKRVAGAVAGLKAGFFLARFTGPKALIATPVFCAAGTVAGAVLGPEVIDKGIKPIKDGAARAWEWATADFRPRALPDRSGEPKTIDVEFSRAEPDKQTNPAVKPA